MDYTKGILERFRAIERFLEQYPAFQRRFSLVQIGAPSRTDIVRYKNFLEEVTAEAERINAKFHAGTVEADCLSEKAPLARRDRALLPGGIGVPGDFAA